MAAGKGTRMKSELPKVLHKAGGWAILRLVAETLQNSQCKQAVFVVGHGRDQVEAEIESWPDDSIEFLRKTVVQKDLLS